MFTWQGVIPFLQALSFLLVIIGFAQVLHQQPFGLVILFAGVMLFFVFFSLWVWSLLVTLIAPADDAQAALKREQKLQWAIRLGVFWMLAFSSSFAMIPLYYWLNGSGGHVHGGMVASQTQDDKMVANDAIVAVYLRGQITTDATPLSLDIVPDVLRLTPGSSAPVQIKITNKSTQKQVYRMVAKTAPDAAKHYFSFDYVDKPQDIVIAPQGSVELKPTLTLAKAIPYAMGDMSLMLFLFSDKVDNAWKKMQNAWNN